MHGSAVHIQQASDSSNSPCPGSYRESYCVSVERFFSGAIFEDGGKVKMKILLYQAVAGFLFGVGLILAVAMMRSWFHIQVC